MSRAAELDKYFEKHKKPKGARRRRSARSCRPARDPDRRRAADPLARGPASGPPSRGRSWAAPTPVPEDDADILKILSKAGAVFYARTTGPQTLVRSSLR